MQIRASQTLRLFLLGIVCLALTACVRPPAIYWSPDGQRGILAGSVANHTLLIDASGKILADYDKSAAFAAWAPDGKTAFIVSEVHPPVALTPVDARWASSPKMVPALLPTTNPADHPEMDSAWPPTFAIQKITGPSIEQLVYLGAMPAEMHCSPDGKWLVLSVGAKHRPGYPYPMSYILLAYHFNSKTLYWLASEAGATFTFTGPNRLAYVQGPAEFSDPHFIGQLREISLDESAKDLHKTSLLDVIMIETPFIQAVGENLVFSSIAHSLPGIPVDYNSPVNFKIYYYSRDDKGLSVIADSAGPFFQVDPSGKQILFQKITPATEDQPRRDEIAVMNLNGSAGHALWPINPDFNKTAMIPTWQDSEHISYISADPAKEQADPANKTTYDVILYQLDPGGMVRPDRNLSQSWAADLKPSLAVPVLIPATAATTTAAATQSTTQPADSQPAATQPSTIQPQTSPAQSQPAVAPVTPSTTATQLTPAPSPMTQPTSDILAPASLPAPSPVLPASPSREPAATSSSSPAVPATVTTSAPAPAQ